MTENKFSLPGTPTAVEVKHVPGDTVLEFTCDPTTLEPAANDDRF